MFKTNPEFHPELPDQYFELDRSTGTVRIAKPLIGHRYIPVQNIRGYRLTIDDQVIVSSDGNYPALIDDSLFTDAGIMGITTPGIKEMYRLFLTIETASGPAVVKYINTRTEVGTLVYSVALLDAEKALKQLDSLVKN
ncbi:hypothetical protein [Lacticaseibacillus daqingensis]|uniref:hypothetical protein n=1 Tax=Lacticaseibacillus daqingensis TaxID=2486014 RepID=UPI000F77CDE4|nr:hypothetical protein [Lacticaseibacillus daqingensis]